MMEAWKIWIMVVVWIIFAGILAFLAISGSGCAAWQGFQRVDKIEEVPSSEKSLWEAAKKSNWLVTLSILGIAGGVFSLANGSVKLGTAVIASASVSLFMSLAVARFALWMAVFGLIGSISAALFSILVRRKALVEIIKGGQAFKKDLNNYPPAPRFNKIQSENQSTITKKIVSKIKNELKLAGKI